MSGKNYIAVIFFATVILVLSYIYYFTGYFTGSENLVIKIIQALWIILFAYLIEELIENTIIRRVHDTKDRYNFRKISSAVITFITVCSLLIVFIEETSTLIIAYGIFSAGIIITLQDVFRNFAGGIIMLFSKSLRPGDRVQIGNCYGDVIDVTYFHTTLMEIKEWIGGDQYSGRIVTIPNNFILSGTVKNYTKDFSFIWDEVTIILTPGSNWNKAREIALTTINDLIHDYIDSSRKELEGMERKYMLTSYDADTRVYMQIKEDRIKMHLRYVADPRKRRYVNDEIVQNLLEAFSREPDILIGTIAGVDTTKITDIITS